MDKKRIIELRGRAQALQATVHIGKDGITLTVIDEVARQLKKSKLVKVKLLPSSESERTEAGFALAGATSSTLVEIRGRTIVLATE